jgi:hypothetical protein
VPELLDLFGRHIVDAAVVGLLTHGNRIMPCNRAATQSRILLPLGRLCVPAGGRNSAAKERRMQMRGGAALHRSS